jgi:hypothetical protein
VAVWVVLGVLLLAPFVYGIGREVRKMGLGMRTRKALLALAERPGWRSVPADEYRRRPWPIVHHGWLDAAPHTVVQGGLDGRDVVLAELFQVGARSGTYWLACYFTLPREPGTVILARAWSAAAMGLPVRVPGLYVPVGADVDALSARLGRGDLIPRLRELGAPAVSIVKNEVCFLYHPMPEPGEIERLVAGLSAVIDDLVTVTTGD